MKTLKRLFRIVFVLTVVLGMGVLAPSVNVSVPIISQPDKGNLGQNAQGLYINNDQNNGGTSRCFKYVYKDIQRYNDYRLGWHQDFDEYHYADGYYFGEVSAKGMTINLDDCVLRVTDGDPYTGSFSIRADSSRKSRPWVRADVEVRIFDVYVYDSVSNKLLTINSNNYREATFSDYECYIDYE